MSRKTPVTFPPGRDKLATQPAATGSVSRSTPTMGVVRLASRAAAMPDGATATSTSRRSDASSSANIRKRSWEPSATRTIISIREPGDALRSPSRTAATRSGSTIADNRGCRNPTRESLVCAVAALAAIRLRPAIIPAAMISRRLVCRERRIVRGNVGRFTTPPPSGLEARSPLSQHSCSWIIQLPLPTRIAGRYCRAERKESPRQSST
jgi:hypothetical protein